MPETVAIEGKRKGRSRNPERLKERRGRRKEEEEEERERKESAVDRKTVGDTHVDLPDPVSSRRRLGAGFYLYRQTGGSLAGHPDRRRSDIQGLQKSFSLVLWLLWRFVWPVREYSVT